MARPSTKHAVLGMMIDSPSYGYMLQHRGSDVLEALGVSESGTYKIINRLEADGWIEIAADERGGTSGRRARRVIYKATPEGIVEFENWMASPAVRPSFRDEFQAKLALSRLQDREQLLATAAAELAACWTELNAMHEPSPALPDVVTRPWASTTQSLLRDYRARSLRARIDWLDYVCQILEAGLNPPTTSSE